MYIDQVQKYWEWRFVLDPQAKNPAFYRLIQCFTHVLPFDGVTITFVIETLHQTFLHVYAAKIHGYWLQNVTP